jgi:hypothetical protein
VAIEQPAGDKKKRTAKWIPAEDVRQPGVYANHVSLEISTWDVRLRFGQVQSADDHEIAVKETALMYMSHSHARAFARALESILNRAEAAQADTPEQSDNLEQITDEG